jgi:hypothetical protein
VRNVFIAILLVAISGVTGYQIRRYTDNDAQSKDELLLAVSDYKVRCADIDHNSPNPTVRILDNIHYIAYRNKNSGTFYIIGLGFDGRFGERVHSFSGSLQHYRQSLCQ